jgi:hypothetical protein
MRIWASTRLGREAPSGVATGMAARASWRPRSRRDGLWVLVWTMGIEEGWSPADAGGGDEVSGREGGRKDLKLESQELGRMPN